MKHVVVDGDCVESIAAQYGFADGKRIKDCPENAALKKVRPDLNVLHPGDEVFVPDRTPKTLSLATGQRHKIVVKRPKRLLRIKFLDGAGAPMSGQYVLKAGSLTIEGSLDGDGLLEQRLPVEITSAEVVLGEVTRTILIGHLNPLRDTPDDGVTGVQARLSNLGFAPGKVDGDAGDKTQAAIRSFQAAHDLDQTGDLDDQTLNKLREEHGS